MKRIPMDELVDFGVRFLTSKGLPEAHARPLSEIVVETEAFRQSSHGLVQFSAMHGALGTTIDPSAEPVVVRDHGATATIDAEGCFGNHAMIAAKELAVAKARDLGIGFVGVRNGSWIGAVGIHLVSIAREGFLAHAWAQTNTCKDCAPIGGIDATFSTNPIGLAFPTDADPVVADFSTATMSMSGANSLIQQDVKTDIPRFIDKAGAESRDPNVINDGGSVMFGGLDTDGHKFYSLSLFIEALTVLAGGSANNPDAPSHQCFSLMVIDPAAFAGADYYQTEMKRFVARVKGSRMRPGHEGIRLPGERGFAALADCRINGVPLDDQKIGILRSIADDTGVALPAGC